MKGLWPWLTREREFPGPLRYIDIFKLRRPVFKLCRLLGFKRIAIILCALVCAVAILHTILNIWAYQVLQEELRKSEAAGIHFDLCKYNLPKAPEAENAAYLYRAAFSLVRSQEKELCELLDAVKERWPEKGPPDAQLRGRMERFLQSERILLALRLLDEATGIPECNWGLRYEEGVRIALHHLVGLRPAAWALIVRAQLRHVSGDQRGAVSDFQAVVRMAERIESDRLVISEVTQQSFCNRCREAAARMVTAEPLSSDTAAALQACFERFGKLVDLSGPLRVEPAMCYVSTEEMRGRPELVREWFRDDSLLSPRFVTYPFRPLYRFSQARYLRYQRELIELSKKPYHEVKGRLEEMQDQIWSERKGFSLPRVLTMVWVLDRTQPQGRANAETVRLGLALEIYRARFGSYPNSLNALVPDILVKLPLDPFTGNSFLYRISEAELAVYSVGENGIDDGGEVWQTRLNPGADDIAWRVPRQDSASD